MVYVLFRISMHSKCNIKGETGAIINLTVCNFAENISLFIFASQGFMRKG